MSHLQSSQFGFLDLSGLNDDGNELLSIIDSVVENESEFDVENEQLGQVEQFEQAETIEKSDLSDSPHHLLQKQNVIQSKHYYGNDEYETEDKLVEEETNREYPIHSMANEAPSNYAHQAANITQVDYTGVPPPMHHAPVHGIPTMTAPPHYSLPPRHHLPNSQPGPVPPGSHPPPMYAHIQQPHLATPTVYVEHCHVNVGANVYGNHPQAVHPHMYVSHQSYQQGPPYSPYMMNDQHPMQVPVNPPYDKDQEQRGGKSTYRGRGRNTNRGRRKRSQERSNSVSSEHSTYSDAGRSHYENTPPPPPPTSVMHPNPHYTPRYAGYPGYMYAAPPVQMMHQQAPFVPNHYSNQHMMSYTEPPMPATDSSCMQYEPCAPVVSQQSHEARVTSTYGMQTIQVAGASSEQIPPTFVDTNSPNSEFQDSQSSQGSSYVYETVKVDSSYGVEYANGCTYYGNSIEIDRSIDHHSPNLSYSPYDEKSMEPESDSSENSRTFNPIVISHPDENETGSSQSTSPHQMYVPAKSNFSTLDASAPSFVNGVDIPVAYSPPGKESGPADTNNNANSPLGIGLSKLTSNESGFSFMTISDEIDAEVLGEEIPGVTFVSSAIPAVKNPDAFAPVPKDIEHSGRRSSNSYSPVLSKPIEPKISFMSYSPGLQEIESNFSFISDVELNQFNDRPTTLPVTEENSVQLRPSPVKETSPLNQTSVVSEANISVSGNVNVQKYDRTSPLNQTNVPTNNINIPKYERKSPLNQTNIISETNISTNNINIHKYGRKSPLNQTNIISETNISTNNTVNIPKYGRKSPEYYKPSIDLGSPRDERSSSSPEICPDNIESMVLYPSKASRPIGPPLVHEENKFTKQKNPVDGSNQRKKPVHIVENKPIKITTETSHTPQTPRITEQVYEPTVPSKPVVVVPVTEPISSPTQLETPTLPTPAPQTIASPPVPDVWGAKKKPWSDLFKSQNENVSKQVARVTPYNPEGMKECESEDTQSKVEVGEVHSQESDREKKKVGVLLKDYSPDYKPIILQPRGLINKNYWCYVNAPLQALLACPSLHQLVKTLSAEAGTNTANESTPFVNSFVDFMSEFPTLENIPKQTKKDKIAKKEPEIAPGNPFEPQKVYKMLINSKGHQFTEGRQQDAEEMLSCVLNGLHDEMVESLKLAGGTATPVVNGDMNAEGQGHSDVEAKTDENEWKVKERKKRSCITRSAHFDTSPISEIFWGELRCVLQKAGNTTANIQPFNTLPLDIQSPKVDTLKDALAQLVVKEEITGLSCSKTNREVTACNQVVIETLPRVLILHLKRFIYDDNKGGLQKVDKRLVFPKDLDITKDLLSQNSKGLYSPSQRRYKLFAVVSHEGKEATKGHYIADVHHPGYNCWLRYDDAGVKVISDAIVQKHDPPRVPYLLFYRRGDTNGTGPANASSSTSGGATGKAKAT